MEVGLLRRVETGLRGLTQTEQRQIKKALKEIGSLTLDEFHQHPKVHQFTAGSGEQLYAFPGTKEFQLVLSLENNKCTVEDVFLKERLCGFLANLGQPMLL